MVDWIWKINHLINNIRFLSKSTYLYHFPILFFVSHSLLCLCLSLSVVILYFFTRVLFLFCHMQDNSAKRTCKGLKGYWFLSAWTNLCHFFLFFSFFNKNSRQLKKQTNNKTPTIIKSRMLNNRYQYCWRKLLKRPSKTC